MIKPILLTFLLLSYASLSKAQNKAGTENDIVLTYDEQKTRVFINDKGLLQASLSPKDVAKFKAAGVVNYNDLGAKGDGKTDDINVIAATHAFANTHGLKVSATPGTAYYISGKKRTAVIQTDTDFGTANFIFDDTDVENRSAAIFMVGSSQKPVKLTAITSLKRGQPKIDTPLPGPCLISVTNSNVKQYIRFGLNQNSGSSQTDIFVADKNGNIDMQSPIIWDFEQITDITALPIDEGLLKITGGNFTTIANKEESKYNYYSRGFAVRRSHVLIEGLRHNIIGEGDHGAPYGGFINVGECAYVTVKNTTLTGHRTYGTIGAAGEPVKMGTYDLSINRALNVSFINCSQTNSIDDNRYWGIIGSNFCKNLVYDSCTLSRFDAHQGVANATIRNSNLGHMGINAIGSGLLKIENSTVRGRSFVNLRPDYGSTWQGEVLITNCVFIPAGGKSVSASLISGSNSGEHDFGYICYMPAQITIEKLRIDDSAHPENYNGPAIFGNFNPKMKDDGYQQKFPYVITNKVILKDVTTTSGKALRISDNKFMFKDVKVEVN
ncbi:MAG: hypothetical protein V4619_19220 [Bacteroidota bacterium]